MLDYFIAILFGIVQGVTEFLPVSSSGHLVLMHLFLDIPVGDELAFDVFLHFASLLAVIYFFRDEIIKLIKGVFKPRSAEQRLSFSLIIGTVPAVIAGLLLDDIIEQYLRNASVVLVMLLVVGLLFFVAEKLGKKNKLLYDVTIALGLFIGIFQVLALIPGTSRSGITIIAGMLLGLKRVDAIKFSFLLSIPIIFGASMKEMVSIPFSQLMMSGEIILYLFSSVATLVTSFFVIKYLIKFASKISLEIFGIYRILLAVILFFLIYF